MQRRELLKTLSVSAVALSFSFGCQRPHERAAVLAALVREVVVPQTRALSRASAELATACSRLAEHCGNSELEAARGALRETLLAWKRAHSFKNGPIADGNTLLRAAHWPARPSAIEAALASDQPLDASRVEALGVDAKGLFAIEYLLFPFGSENPITLEQLTANDRRRQLCHLLAQHVATGAARVERALADGRAFAERFAAGGQQSLSRLVNQLIGTLETLAGNRLDLVLGLSRDHHLKASDVEGSSSGLSQQLALAELEGVARLYGGEAGGGLGDLLADTAPPIARRARECLEQARETLRAVAMPLENAAHSNRQTLVRALAAVKALEICLKVDAVSALGVTLTFQGTDGD